jgi:hypothetical protein
MMSEAERRQKQFEELEFEASQYNLVMMEWNEGDRSVSIRFPFLSARIRNRAFLKTGHMAEDHMLTLRLNEENTMMPIFEAFWFTNPKASVDHFVEQADEEFKFKQMASAGEA